MPGHSALRPLKMTLHFSSCKSCLSKLAIAGPCYATQGVVATLSQPLTRKRPDGRLPARPMEIACKQTSLAVSSHATHPACVRATPPGSTCRVP